MVAAPDETSIDATATSFSSYSSPAQSYLSRINTHSYSGSARTQLANLANSYSKALWMSEYGDNDATGLTMSRRILDDMKNLRPTAWVYWQAVDNAGGWGFLRNPLQDEITTGYTTNEKYYVMGNYSKFIRPGYQFIAINDANSLAAYDASSGTLVIVTTNSGAQDTNVTYDLSGFTTVGDSAIPYRTSPGENLAQLPAIGVSDNAFATVSKARSVTTYVLSGVTYSGALGFDPNAYFEVVNRHSGLVLDVTGASTTDGAQIIQWYENGTANQQWEIVGLGAGNYKFVNRNSGLLLDVSGGSISEGANVIQWHDHDGSNQQWGIGKADGGFFKIINRNSGLLMDVSGASIDAGAHIIQWHDHDGDNQQWSLVPVTLPQHQAQPPILWQVAGLNKAVNARVEGSIQSWNQAAPRWDAPYFPDWTPHWENNPHSGNETPVTTGRTLDQDETFPQPARFFVAERRTRPALVYLSFWSEWTEDHYLDVLLLPPGR
jgi:hypothetical protein